VPDKIFVRPFSYWAPGLDVDRSGRNLEEFRYEFREKFTRHLVKRLTKAVAPAAPVAETAPMPKGNYWLVSGRFDRVEQGSRLLRSFFGFGLGGTKLETSVVITDLSTKPGRPFLLIQTTGGSNAHPGAIGTAAYAVTGVTALFSATNLLEGTRSGLTFDAIRTTREVTAATTTYLANTGALPAEKEQAWKRPGFASWWPFQPREDLRGQVTVTPAR